VQRVNPDTEGATRLASDRDYSEIRRNADDEPIYEDGEPAEPAAAAGERFEGRAGGYAEAAPQDAYRGAPREIYREDRGSYRNPSPARNRQGGYGGGKQTERRRQNPERQMRLERDELRDFDGGRDDDFEEEKRNPGLEKLTTVLAILAALVLGGIVIFLAARTMGVLPDSTTATTSGASATAATTAAVMPDVAGQDAVAVKEQLTKLGLTVQVVYNDSDTVESGKVISADIKAGQKLTAGAPVTLTVSAGENGIAVPDVTGKTKAEAKTILEQQGFKVNLQEQASNDVDEDTVISQSPTSDDKAPTGSVVTLTISSGPDNSGKVQVPTITGMTEEDAMAVLTESKLKLGNTTEVTNPDANLKGLVCSQSEEAGTYVDEGTAIDIEVSKGTGETTSYYYTADIEAPTAAEDPNYMPGTQVYLVIIAADGTQLYASTTTTFPVHVSYTNLSAETGTLQMTYLSTTDATVTTDPVTGQTVTTPGTSTQKTVTRSLTFTAEN
jgi:beta-lactam-binding protein with PASTA domain